MAAIWCQWIEVTPECTKNRDLQENPCSYVKERKGTPKVQENVKIPNVYMSTHIYVYIHIYMCIILIFSPTSSNSPDNNMVILAAGTKALMEGNFHLLYLWFQEYGTNFFFLFLPTLWLLSYRQNCRSTQQNQEIKVQISGQGLKRSLWGKERDHWERGLGPVMLFAWKSWTHSSAAYAWSCSYLFSTA